MQIPPRLRLQKLRGRIPAMLGFLIFVCGILVLPFLHGLGHREDHHHGQGGHHHAPQDAPDPRPGENSHAAGGHHHSPQDAPDPRHGEGSLEHGSLHFTEALPILLVLLSVPLQETLVENPDRTPRSSRPHACLQPRAPPLSFLV